MQKTPTEKFWLIVWDRQTGAFKNAQVDSEKEDTKSIKLEFEQKNPKYMVVELGKGERPPQGFRLLPYAKLKAI